MRLHGYRLTVLPVALLLPALALGKGPQSLHFPRGAGGRSSQNPFSTTVYAGAFPGATIDARIAAAENALPVTGGIIDASSMSGPQTWSNTVKLTKPTKILLNGQIKYNGPPLPSGLIDIQSPASGSEIFCANGIGIMPVNPPYPAYRGPPAVAAVAANPPNLDTQWWQCYLETNPTGPLASANISRVTSVPGEYPALGVATLTDATAAFPPGQPLRVKGTSDESYDGWVIADGATFTGSISGSTLTVHKMQAGVLFVGARIDGGYPLSPISGVAPGTLITAMGTGLGGAGTYTVNNPQRVANMVMSGFPTKTSFAYARPFAVSRVTGGTATSYMPVIKLDYGTNGVSIHDMDFVPNANTGDVISEAGYSQLGFAITNHHFYRNQFVRTDTVGAAGYAIDMSSMRGLGEDFNNQEVSWNLVEGLSGCFYIANSQMVGVQLVGNFCAGPVDKESVSFDIYQSAIDQNIDYRLNQLCYSRIPANSAAMAIMSGYNIQIENNDFELNNQLGQTNTSALGIYQVAASSVRQNTFLEAAAPFHTAQNILTGGTVAYSNLSVTGNHTGDGAHDIMWNNPVVGGGEGQLNYYFNEGQIAAKSFVAPFTLEYSGSGSGAQYTTTSSTFVPIDLGRLVAGNIIVPNGMSLHITTNLTAYQSDPSQSVCVAVMDSASTVPVVNSHTMGSGLTRVNLNMEVHGDSNVHTYTLEFSACSGGGIASIQNIVTSTDDDRPRMTLTLRPIGYYSQN